jgi:hypothetical protein
LRLRRSERQVSAAVIFWVDRRNFPRSGNFQRHFEVRQIAQPQLRVVGCNDCALSSLSSLKAASLDFCVCFGAADAVVFAKGANAHRPLQYSTQAFAL